MNVIRLLRKVLPTALSTAVGASLLLSTVFVARVSIGDGISGTATQFRSLVVNGIHYSTNNTIVRINGRLGQMDELRIGHQLVAEVDHETLTVLEVDQYDAVSGRVEEVEVIDETLARMVFVVNGQEVRTGLDTVFHINDPMKLKKGKYVTAGGLRTEDGVIVATALEAADKDDDVIISGLVSDLDDTGFSISGLRIVSPYMLEFLTEPWLTEGVAVLVRGERQGGGDLEELEVYEVMPVPSVIVVRGEYFEFGDARIDGTIESYDTANDVIVVSGVRVHLDEFTTLHDSRDGARPFGLIDIYPEDIVSLSVEQNGDRVRARKLTRVGKAKPLLRGPLESVDENSDTVMLFGERVYKVSEAKEIRFGRNKVKREDAAEVLEHEKSLEVWLHHVDEAKHVKALPDCDALLQPILEAEGKSEVDKTLRNKLKENNRRAFYCT